MSARTSQPVPEPVVPADGTGAGVDDETTGGTTGGLDGGTDDGTARRGAPDGPVHDEAWFTDLVRQHSTAVHRFLVRRAGAVDADDLTADVLVVAWRRRADVPDGAQLPWLYRTASFVLANHRRKARPVPMDQLPERPATDDDPALRAVTDERVHRVLAGLAPRDRQILLLAAWEGLGGAELAQVLGIGRGGADAALSRARSRLAAAWAADEA